MSIRTAFARGCTAALCLQIATPALAQTTATLTVEVVDDQGLPLPRAAVSLSGDDMLGGAQRCTADEAGICVFRELLPGSYDLQAAFGDYGSIAIEDLQLEVRGNHRRLVLDGGEYVLVTPPPDPVDPTDTTVGDLYDRDVLDRLPTGRSIWGTVGLTAGMDGSWNGRGMGAAGNENTILLDGTPITDPVTGTIGRNFNFDALDSVEVLLGGVEPEHGRSLGATISLVTRSGSNNLELDASAFHSNGGWSGRLDERWGADGRQLAPSGFDSTYRDVNIGTLLAGPVVKDKLYFMVSTQHARSLLTVNGTGQPRDYDGHYVLGKLTGQAGSAHRLTALVQLDPTTVDNNAQGSPLVLPEAQERLAQGGFVATGRWQWLPDHRRGLDTTLTVQKQYLELSATPCVHSERADVHACRPDEPEGDIDWETPGRTGVGGAMDSVNFGQYAFDDRYRFQAGSKLSLLELTDPAGGRHELELGVESVHSVWDQLQAISGNTLYTDIQLVAGDPDTFANYYWIETTGPIRFRTSGSEFSAFVQDAWAVRPNLTVKYGTRFDRAVMRNDVGEPVIRGNLWGPRLFVAWDPGADGRTQIAGGFGRYNDGARLATAAFTSHAGYGSKLFLGEAFADSGLGTLNAASDSYQVLPPERARIAHDELRMPRSDELLLKLRRQLSDELAVGATVTAKRTRHLYEYDETNRIYDEDGSQVVGSRTGDTDIAAYRLRTPVLATRDYVQADVRVDKVLARRWFGRATASVIRSWGTTPTSLSGSFANDPQSRFAYGPMLGDVLFTARAMGSWQLPTDPASQTLGFTLTHSAGRPLERLYAGDFASSIRIRERGAYTRGSSNTALSLKFTQELPLPRGDLQLDLEALNLLNHQAPLAWSGAALQRENRLVTLGRQSPARVQLGARYRF